MASITGALPNRCTARSNRTKCTAPTDSPATGLTPTCRRVIDNGAEADCTNTPATEVGQGRYRITLSAADLNGRVIAFRAVGSPGPDTLITLFTQDG